MNDKELLRAKLKLYSEILITNAEIDRKAIMSEMQKLALRLRDSE